MEPKNSPVEWHFPLQPDVGLGFHVALGFEECTVHRDPVDADPRDSSYLDEKAEEETISDDQRQCQCCSPYLLK